MSNLIDERKILHQIFQNKISFEDLPNSLKESKDFLLSAISVNNSFYKKLSNRFLKDINFHLELISINVDNIKCFSQEILKDEVFLTSFLNNDKNENYFNSKFLPLKEITNIDLALKINTSSFAQYNVKLQKDKSFLLKLLDKYEQYYIAIDKEFKKDEDIVYKILTKNLWFYKFTPKELDTKDFILRVLNGIDEKTKNFDVYILLDFNHDIEYIKILMKKKPSLLLYLNQDHMNDREILLENKEYILNNNIVGMELLKSNLEKLLREEELIEKIKDKKVINRNSKI